MSSFGIRIPTPPDSPPPPPSDAAYAAELSRRLHARQDDVVDRFLELLAEHCYRTDGNPLAQMHDLLSGASGAPITDLYDARSYSTVGNPQDAALAKLVRYCYAVANLTIGEQVRGELSGVEF
jgi:hypothetical protein